MGNLETCDMELTISAMYYSAKINFGKYKNYVSANAMAGITDLALCIAAFTCALAPHELITALEQTTEAQLRLWAHQHIGPTLAANRRVAFSESQK